ncbi:hypothetical protein DFS34DRAFT_619645 [Phlyctochytrium arcticum]|nr:hypothetical protein DFS34DRAFT_619645 [Phlyctochytrium arcticum]
MDYKGIKRPSSKDTEDTLLQLQREFAQISEQKEVYGAPPPPAAKVIRVPRTTDGKREPIAVSKLSAAFQADQVLLDESDEEEESIVRKAAASRRKVETKPKKRSLFAERRAQAQNSSEATPIPESSPHQASIPSTSSKPAARREIIAADDTLGAILSDIVEKNPAVAPAPPTFNESTATQQTGFPEVNHRSHRTYGKPVQTTSAEFYRQRDEVLQKMEEADSGLTKAGLVEGDEERVHDDNLRAIQEMSASELEQAQKEIMEKLDPSLVEMLKRRAEAKYGPAGSSSTPSHDSVPKTPEQPHKGNSSSEQASSEDAMPSLESIPSKKAAKKGEEGSFHSGANKSLHSWIPKDQEESEKLEWMSFLGETRDTDMDTEVKHASALRFDFAGNVLNAPEDSNNASGSDIPAHSGLYHHGQDPDKPGYRLDELLILSRSTHPAQRASSLSILGAIISKLYGSAYGSARTRAILWQTLRANLVINVRIALDDRHDTVLAASIAALCAAVGTGSLLNAYNIEEDQLWDKLLLTRRGYRAHGISVGNQDYLRIRTTGRGTLWDAAAALPTDDPNSMAAIILLVRRDVILGLLKTNILARISYLLRTRNLSSQVVIDMLKFLTRVARHSREAAMDIVETDQLIDTIRRKYLSADAWNAGHSPQTKEVNETTMGTVGLVETFHAIRLIRVLCQGGRDIAEGLININIIDDIQHFVPTDKLTQPSLSNSNLQSLVWEREAQIWSIFGIVFTYGLGARFVDDYRTALWTRAIELLPADKTPFSPSDSSIVQVKTAFLRMLGAATRTFGGMLSIGGTDDAIKPFLDLLVKQDLQDAPIVLQTSVLDLYTEYTKAYIKSQPSGANEWVRQTLATDLMERSGMCKFPLFNVEAQQGEEQGTYGSGVSSHLVGFQNLERVRLGVHLLDINEKLEHIASLLDLYAATAPASSDTCNPSTRKLMNDSVLKQWLAFASNGDATGRTPFVPSEDLLRYLVPGRAMLLYTWLFAAQTLEDHCGSDSVADMRQKCSVALATLPQLLPGDEYVAARVLNRYILHPKVQELLAQLERNETPGTVAPGSEETVVNTRQRLQELLDYDMYTTGSLIQSEGLFGRRPDELNSLLWEHVNLATAETDGPESGAADLKKAMPVRADWLFILFERLLFESKKYNRLAAKRQLVPRADADAVIIECLKLISRLEVYVKGLDGGSPIVQVSRGTKLARLMCIFLLPSTSSDPNDGELFQREDVSRALRLLLQTYAADNASLPANQRIRDWDLNGGSGDQGRFYQLYTDLIDHYSAVSFGDTTFTQYLILPLSMSYPADFRELFWTQLVDLLPIISLKADEIYSPGGIEDFTRPVETEPKVLQAYAHALVEKKVTKMATPFLFEVAMAHVAGYVQVGTSEQIKARLRQVLDSVASH